LKVLHISTAAGGSGAGIAAKRIHNSLRRINVNSQLIARHHYGESNAGDEITEINNVLGSIGKKALPHLDKLPLLSYPEKSPPLFSTSWIPNPLLIKKINQIKPDLINLHWINFSFLKIEQLKQIACPVVWTMHDNWVFTGGCHYAESCTKYQENCGKCPELGSHKEKDLSRRIWQRKHETFDQVQRLYTVSPSHWLRDCASQSSLLKDRQNKVIANPIDCDNFKAIDKKTARKSWGLPFDKKIILFGALSATSDKRKGFDLLVKALKMTALNNTELVVFGSESSSEVSEINCPSHFTGMLDNENDLVRLYSAADVMVVPSRQEAFGQTAAEAMACETPVVAFGNSGLSDIVNHKTNGYLAQPGNAQDLSIGIKYLLESDAVIGKKAREKVLSTFEETIIAKQYRDFYQHILSTND